MICWHFNIKIIAIDYNKFFLVRIYPETNKFHECMFHGSNIFCRVYGSHFSDTNGIQQIRSIIFFQILISAWKNWSQNTFYFIKDANR